MRKARPINVHDAVWTKPDWTLRKAWRLVPVTCVTRFRHPVRGMTLAVLILLGAAGCTAEQLRDDTLQAASTLTDIQDQMVLDNVAIMASNPGLLPWHIRLATGSVEVRDQMAAELGLNALTWRPGAAPTGATAVP